MQTLFVEMRKVFLTPAFYIALLLFNFVISFLLVETSGKGNIVSMSGDISDVSFNELYFGLLQMVHYVGLPAIAIAIIMWHSLGKEIDQKSILIYLLNTSSKMNLLFSKAIVFILAYSMLLISNAFITFLVYETTSPKMSLLFEEKAVIEGFENFILIGLNGVAIILISMLSTYYLGSIGLLIGTIGFTIFTNFFKDHVYLKEYMPINLINIESGDPLKSALILSGYIAICVAIALILNKIESIKISI